MKQAILANWIKWASMADQSNIILIIKWNVNIMFLIFVALFQNSLDGTNLCNR